MRSPYGLDIIDDCVRCELRTDGFFCGLSTEVLKAFEALKYATVLPKGAILFVEGQSPRGIFLLCTGRAKLSTCSSDGRSLITQIAEPGDLLGLSAVISGRPYEITAETLRPCQVNFIKREDFLRFLSEHGEACMRVANHLSNTYHNAYEQVRSLGLSHSASEKLARLLLAWSERGGVPTENGISLKVTLTHEEIAQSIGISRETVTRLLAEFKNTGLIYIKGATLVIRDRAALDEIANS